MTERPVILVETRDGVLVDRTPRSRRDRLVRWLRRGR